jgi:hypothetical protein
LRERDPLVGRGLIVPRDRRVRDPAEIVVKQLLPSERTGPRPVEDGVVLEQILAAVDRPHLPAVERRDEIHGDGHEVARARRGPGQQDEHVSGRGGPDPQHAHAVRA